MRVVAWSQNMTAEIAKAAGAEFVSKNELFKQADIVTLHVILSARTEGLVGREELQAMKPTALLVNASRGPVVDETALIEALTSKSIAGAAIDVFAEEPLPTDHPFRRIENVLATPHVGFVADDQYRTFYGDTVRALESWLDQRVAD
jgi:phosphoglycerate dehydrogenase-like enzyme